VAQQDTAPTVRIDSERAPLRACKPKDGQLAVAPGNESDTPVSTGFYLRAADLDNRRTIDICAVPEILICADRTLEGGARLSEHIDTSSVAQHAAVRQLSGRTLCDGYAVATVILNSRVAHAEGSAVRAKNALTWAVLDCEPLDRDAAGAVNGDNAVEFHNGPAPAIKGCCPLSVQCYSICLDAHLLDAGPRDANGVARFGPSQDFCDVLSAIAIHHSHARGGIACASGLRGATRRGGHKSHCGGSRNQGDRSCETDE